MNPFVTPVSRVNTPSHRGRTQSNTPSRPILSGRGRSSLSEDLFLRDDQPGTDEDGPKIYSVREINREVKLILETQMEPVWVSGEISNFTHHSSGHFYFSLKDESSQLRSVMFRRQNVNLTFTPANGQKVVAYGDISVYEPRGEYQLIVRGMRPSGLGELMIALQALKEKLAAEGLFDEDKKKPIPTFPTCVGIVTSATGAAVRDIIRVASGRFPDLLLILAPARVQGEGAAAEIAHAIGLLDQHGQADCIIVGRGGGSIEDLWAFNEEVVVRAIARARTPVISAVGHEIDFTLADLAADVRAATPSAAAEMVTPDRRELRARLDTAGKRLLRSLTANLDQRRQKLENTLSRYGFRRPLDSVAREQQRLDGYLKDLGQAIRIKMKLNNDRLRGMDERLRSLDPKNVLARGFSITRRKTDDRIVKSSTEIESGTPVTITFHEGWADASVTGVDGDGEDRD
ncbi:exodeoxyribonuclease VII large subunit [candidate division KSB1 bacterium]